MQSSSVNSTQFIRPVIGSKKQHAPGEHTIASQGVHPCHEPARVKQFICPWTRSGSGSGGEHGQYNFMLIHRNQTCVSDLNGNGIVDVTDILSLIAAWGPCSFNCPADFNGDNMVDFTDLLTLIDAWGACG